MLADGGIAPPRTLHALLGASPAPLTHKDLLTRWPGDKPREDSLWRALARGLETGLMHMTGEGTESAPPPLHAGAKGRGLRTRCRSFAVEFAAVDVVSAGWWNCDTCGGGGTDARKDAQPLGGGPRSLREWATTATWAAWVWASTCSAGDPERPASGLGLAGLGGMLMVTTSGRAGCSARNIYGFGSGMGCLALAGNTHGHTHSHTQAVSSMTCAAPCK